MMIHDRQEDTTVVKLALLLIDHYFFLWHCTLETMTFVIGVGIIIIISAGFRTILGFGFNRSQKIITKMLKHPLMNKYQNPQICELPR